jgi:hypothetical protein
MMNKRLIGTTVVVLIVVTLGIAFVNYFIFSTRGLMLVAKETVPVYATEDQAMTWPHPSAMTELSAGRSVPVTKCVDVKHYLIYKVHLPDGRDGFVLDGKYDLIRNGSQTSC